MVHNTRLLDLQEQICRLGQDAYRGNLSSEEFWYRLDWLESTVRELVGTNQDYQFLQYKVDRHLNFGEPLD